MVTHPCPALNPCAPANLQAILSSEQQLAQLMGALDEALAEVGRLEQSLQVCEELLGAGNSQVPALGGTVAAPGHRPHHEELLPFTPLMAWLRSSNPALFWDLSKVYSQNFGRLYEREIRALFEQAKISLWAQGCSGVPSESQRAPRPKVVSQQVLEQVLSELQPLCTSEQQFLQEFFCLGCGSVELEVRSQSQAEEATTQLLSEIFSCLEPELRAFLDVCGKAQPLGCLQVLVALSDSVLGTPGLSSSPSSSFLHSLLGNVLLLAKSNLNKCIGTLCKEMEEAKPASRTRGGILPCVSRFQELVALSEEMFQTCQRRGELDRAQLRLASSVLSSISSLSSANLKVNTDMVMMENFHHIHNFLCQRNIPCLEGKKREAKQRCREHMEKYISTYVGQPLERLKHFFEGVKARLAQGVKEEELSFQLAYSKQELRKVIEKYPGKEVKRALESLYRTMHKHLSPEGNLLPYQEFEELIQRCYAGAGIALDFTMEDLLSYFNSITMAN
ncbi:hypothetical protein EK904_007653, partial [Melospiza melodia maxima]